MYIKYVYRSYELIQLNVRNLLSTIYFMKTMGSYIFYLSLLISIFMGCISYLSQRRYKEKELANLTEFWVSLGVNALVAELFENMLPQVVALSMVGWIWPLRTFRLMLEDIRGKNLLERYEVIVFGLSGFTTVALASYGYPFSTYTLPFCLGVAFIGLERVIRTVRTSKEYTPLHWATFCLMGIFFLSRAAFPFWRISEEEVPYNFLLDLILYVGFAGVSIATYMEFFKKRHADELNFLLKERNDRLLAQSKYSELGMMSAGIAHEINNPLAVIQARTTQLLRIYRDPERQKDLADGLQQILYTSERINRTIQGVREFVHQDEKGPMTEVGLKDLVDDVLAFCGQRMKNHGINLRFYGLENYTVIGNKIQLEQVILNLLNNSFDAIEFLPDKWIEVSVHQTSEKVQIYVKDSGNGIPPEIASRIMEPFFSTKDLGKGTGLGLALARGIAEKHGGTLVYLPETTHTTFMIELPRFLETEWGTPLHH